MSVQGADPKLVLAVPSKGRLQDNAASFFSRAGLTLVQGRGARDYRGAIAGLPEAEVLFLSASEIAGELAQGSAHLGITGEDLIRESIPEPERRVELLTGLGFGHANVVVAVPQAWIDVKTMSDLEDVASGFRARHGQKLEVATKFLNLTRQFFAQHGITDYRIVESLGATEGAPGSGAAELIVDITTTGGTLAANALKIVEDGVILRSEANLVASVGAAWGPTACRAAATILSRIAAGRGAHHARGPRDSRPGDAAEPRGDERKGSRRGRSDPPGEGGSVFQCPQVTILPFAEWLVSAGAQRVAVTRSDYVFSASNTLVERLERRIG